jgi:hypothetical protein
MMQLRINGAWVSPTAVSTFTNGAWRSASNAKAYISGAWRDIMSFSSPPTLTISGDTISYSRLSNPFTATPTSGQAPFTYVWSVTVSDAPVTITTPTSATTTARISSIVQNLAATLGCIAADALGRTASGTIDCVFNFSIGPNP